MVDEISCTYDLSIDLMATHDYSSVDLAYYVVCGDLIYTFDDKIENLISGNTYQSRYYDASVECDCEFSVMMTLYYVDDNDAQQEMGCGFYDWVSLQGITVPVELIDFQLTEEEEKTFISWTTAMEISLDNFLVEHSTDGRIFRTINETPAKNEASYYQVELEHRTGYYRLKSMNLDGSHEYSDVIFHKASTRYTLQRNVIDADEPINVLVYDSMGRILFDDLVESLDLNQLDYFGVKFIKIDQDIIKLF